VDIISQHMPWMPDMELQDLMFVILHFSLAIIPLILCMPPFCPFRMGMFIRAILSWNYVTV
jgi:hypothetical protein